MGNANKIRPAVYRIIALIFLLSLYCVLRVNKLNIYTLKQNEQVYQKEIKNKENYISDLKNELRLSSTKGFIEQQARLDGFIMPEDIHFVYDINIHKNDNNSN